MDITRWFPSNLFRTSESFRVAEARSHAEIEQEFGDCEEWLYCPMYARPRFSAEPDPERARYTLTGIFSYESRLAKLGMEEMGVGTRTPCLLVQRVNLRGPVRKGDVLRRCSDDTTWEITSREKDTYSGVEIKLTQKGVPE